MKKLNEQTVIRLPEGTAERAERLAEVMARSPEFEAIGRVCKSLVLRLAMIEGLAALEKRFLTQKTIGKNR